MTSAPATHANDPVVCALRENCVRLTEAAEASILFGPIFMLIARILARLGDMFILWRDGKLVLVQAPPRPRSKAPRARSASRRRHRSVRRPRPAAARTPSAAHRRESARMAADTPRRTTRRPVDRYPKSA